MRRVLMVLIAAVLATDAAAEPIDPGRIRVIDGAAIRIAGHKPDHRLVGFNTPELRRARNELERELGAAPATYFGCGRLGCKRNSDL
ncbi:hypothetical protein [Rhodopseudomonas palustris]|uniref:hypothetical protein n=1 Tax=Rhodopseudomonas palustris TaxID=1076 RepID=UPI0021F2BD7C|nr:hypothetical protein [Rhodopseudomonas palustris]